MSVCMQRMDLIFKALLQYQPGEVQQESPDIQAAYNTEVYHIYK